ncbi:carboxypeptidase M32 [Cohnella sp. CFH 77786]|uniref:carboxypeptidase M32 n=1 Tax=Cohnella sp. CFH 77786 TaxID=2662265 RepID=UPI001C608C0F|nr:carboxypeptidase M32 [Cohnella sp. CFH 77786]MBW5448312.1 carboxypeptidase M32 [Cohnella sp. CFH 77786]
MSAIRSTEALETAVRQFKELDETMSHYSSMLSLASWDQQTKAPHKGKVYFAKARGTLSTELFRLATSDRMGALLDVLTGAEAGAQLDEPTRAAVRERKREFDQKKKIPESLHKEFTIHTANARTVWEEARRQNDFAKFRPTLERTVEYVRQYAELYGYEKHPYDAHLDQYEPGLTVQQLDRIFGTLREQTVRLLDRIRGSSDQPRDVFEGDFDIAQQEKFNLYLLPRLGYDLDAGRLDVTAHPFACTINVGDVRITTRYFANDPRSSLFATIHETGHAIYEQGINPEFEGSVISGGVSLGIHESQSRFLENMVGRSLPFWERYFDDYKRYFPGKFDGVSARDFYRSVNIVKPSYIRVEADEVTYNLHVMIRYEIEKGLVEGTVEVKDLPAIWNAKMREYLGVEPPTDTEGVLQDVHWSYGAFGYFPTYSLGNLYSAQIRRTILKQFPDFEDIVRRGEFAPIREWLRENIHRHGSVYMPAELIERVTGEPLNPEYLVRYFEEKYSDIYGI